MLDVGPERVLAEHVAVHLQTALTQHLEHGILSPAVDLRALLHVQPPVSLLVTYSQRLGTKDQNVLRLHLELHGPRDVALRVDPGAPLGHNPMVCLREVRRTTAEDRRMHPPHLRPLAWRFAANKGATAHLRRRGNEVNESADLWVFHLDEGDLNLGLRDDVLWTEGLWCRPELRVLVQAEALGVGRIETDAHSDSLAQQGPLAQDGDGGSGGARVVAHPDVTPRDLPVLGRASCNVLLETLRLQALLDRCRWWTLRFGARSGARRLCQCPGRGRRWHGTGQRLGHRGRWYHCGRTGPPHGQWISIQARCGLRG
mmetsp:Transcript_40795/g.121934  ORF Transcript_40795/g.121934 Transcript_40795/m.121934 type:complete len:314 (-) Transcript_40795:791-1732(-)